MGYNQSISKHECEQICEKGHIKKYSLKNLIPVISTMHGASSMQFSVIQDHSLYVLYNELPSILVFYQYHK